jgi:hypothetical protein
VKNISRAVKAMILRSSQKDHLSMHERSEATRTRSFVTESSYKAREAGFDHRPWLATTFAQVGEILSLCSARQLRRRPPPGMTPVQKVFASPLQAARSAAVCAKAAVEQTLSINAIIPARNIIIVLPFSG